MLDKLVAPLNKIRSSRWMRFFFQLFVFVLASFYVVYFTPFAREVRPEVLMIPGWKGQLTLINWCSFVLLCRALLFDRHALGVGLIAGIIWLFFGDAVAMPFWAGLVALLVHLFRNLRSFGNIHLWYTFIGICTLYAYAKTYVLTEHPVYLMLCVLCIVGYYLYGLVQQIVARRHKEVRAVQEAIQAEEKRAAERIVPVMQQLEQQIIRLDKMSKLPAPVKHALTDIIASARLILRCMQTDKRDEQPGRQFLERYLPMAETIVLKGQALSTQLDDEAQQHQALTGQLDALDSLKAVFREQHRKLLENDQDDLTAELSTLEKMLKADGFKK